MIFFYCDLYSAIWNAASCCSRDTKRYRIIFTGNEKGTFKTRKQPSRNLARATFVYRHISPYLYIGRIFTTSRPDASIGSEISMPTYQARLSVLALQHMSYVVVNAKVALTRSEIQLLIYLALIIFCLLSSTH